MLRFISNSALRATTTINDDNNDDDDDDVDSLARESKQCKPQCKQTKADKSNNNNIAQTKASKHKHAGPRMAKRDCNVYLL